MKDEPEHSHPRCLEADEVLDFIDTRLTPSQMAALQEHMDGCDTCRRWVMAMARAPRSGEHPSASPGPELGLIPSGNNRMLRFAALPRTSGTAADAVLGQDDTSSRIPASSPGDLAHLAGPAALATDDTYLYVLDRDLGRVLVYPAGPVGLVGVVPTGSASAPVQAVLRLGGGLEGLTLLAAAGIAAERTAAFTTRLYLADTGGDRVVRLASVSRLADAE